MTLTQLRAEIDTDPLGLGYAALVAAGSDAGIAALMNERAYRGPVPIRELSSLCLALGVTGTVQALIEIPIGSEFAPGVTMSIALKAGLYRIVTLIQTDYRLETADADDSSFAAGCAQLIALGFLDAAGKAALLALGDNRLGRAEVLWGVPVSANDVAAALGRA